MELKDFHTNVIFTLMLLLLILGGISIGLGHFGIGEKLNIWAFWLLVIGVFLYFNNLKN